MKRRGALWLIPGSIAAMVLFVTIAGARLRPGSYLGRCILWGDSDTGDYLKFPARAVENAPPAFCFKEDEASRLSLAGLAYTAGGKKAEIDDAERFMQETGTTAFIVIQDDAIRYEGYFDGSRRESVNTSFSMAKSFVSTLIGAAVDEGLIKSVDEPITNYLPELKRDPVLARTTIRHLLMMASGIRYVEGPLFFGDDAKTYYSPEMRRTALSVRTEGEPGRYFLYNNYHPLLLGVILERATGQSVAGYLQEKIWQPLGMEYPASWSLDSERSGFEKMESGLNARSIDYAKFGRLFLRGGDWEGKRIVSEAWVREATDMTREKLPAYNKASAYNSDRINYGYMWWGYSGNGRDYDYACAGKYGQFIYVSPRKRAIIVRNGYKEGGVDWYEVFYNVTERM